MTAQEQAATLLAGGRFHEAADLYRQLLQAQPASAALRTGLAHAHAGAGDAWAAVAWLADACRVAPDDAACAHRLAELLLNLKHYAQALPVYRRLYDGLGARDRATLLHYGYCLEHTGDLDGAVRLYREAIAQEPDFMEAHVDLAGVLWRIEDHAGALVHAQRAAALAPQHPYAVRILGTALLHLNRLDEAQAQLRRALQLQPDFALAAVDLSLTLLLAGQLKEGWAQYSARWTDTVRMARPVFHDPALEWQGPQRQPLKGRRIIVYAEQGLGDVIHFIRYVPLLQAGGAQVIAVVQPELATLLASIPGLHCYRPGEEVSADGHVALLDLPMHLGTTLDSIPSQVPYLQAPEAKVAHWRERLKPWDGKRKVGIAWAGSPAQVNNRNRSMPLSELAPLLDVPGVQCFSLQKGPGGGYTDIQPGAQQLVDLTDEWADFSDSAAMIDNLDLVITVDSAVAHLAGALGKPVWVLLGPNPDWRWLLEREDSPWYPTMRLFRRGFGEARAAQVGRVAQALAGL